MRRFEETLAELIRPEVESMGFILWGVTSPSTGRKRVIRIYVDGPDGINIDQCADVSRQVGLMLEVEDIIPGAYTLEVSSPGLERRFFSPAQLRDYLGRTVSAQALEVIDGRRRFHGVLTACFEDSFTLDEDGETISLNWADLREVRLVHEF
ncbi:ribosome maturation factor RimP [Pseudodesulfovibrio sp.]|uniref:ribosome maturation factor RimP n=1 Tax=unclassified Pseudodesulfovibrio TaxID=2661612 RepID=UPI003B008087